MRAKAPQHSQSPVHRTAGFTIIELMVALTIFGIIASFGVPALSNLVSSQRIVSNERVLISNIKYAQSEAVKRNSPVTICVAATPTSCDNLTTSEWNQGWLVFTDDNGDRTVDLPPSPGTPGDEILRAQSGIEKMTFYFTGNQKAITFIGAGQNAAGGDIDIRFCEKKASNPMCNTTSFEDYHESITVLSSGQILVL